MSKYRSTGVRIDGYYFRSKKEGERYVELKYMQRAKEISALETQPKFTLIPENNLFRALTYNADFRYIKNGNTIVEDVKPSYRTVKSEQAYKRTQAYRAFKDKQKMMYHILGILVQEV